MPSDPVARRPVVLVVAGPSGAGKGSITQRLLQRDERLRLSRSWTTRSRRLNEPPDWYTFVDRPTFEAKAADHGFLEWAEVFDNLYGTPLPEVDDDVDVILEIDVQGAQQVRERLPESVVVFVRPPSRGEQERRLHGRGDPPELIERRLAKADAEEEVGIAIADLVVVNDELERATDIVRAFLRGLRAGLARCPDDGPGTGTPR